MGDCSYGDMFCGVGCSFDELFCDLQVKFVGYCLEIDVCEDFEFWFVIELWLNEWLMKIS